MDQKTAAIILCAGIGSRIGLPKEQNKCALPMAGTTPVGYTASALLKAGADKLIVVVGHASDSVKNALKDYVERGQVEFAVNPHYNWHGCNYSLACGMGGAYIENAERVIIAEGDSLLHPGSIQQLLCQKGMAASLIRSGLYVDYTRSVVAVGTQGAILRYEYDTTHTGRSLSMLEGEEILGDSMQLWSFSGEPLQRLKEQLREYKREADKGEAPFVHSGVYSINRIGLRIEPIHSDYPEDWINLNTQEDLRKAGNVKWLIK